MPVERAMGSYHKGSIIKELTTVSVWQGLRERACTVATSLELKSLGSEVLRYGVNSSI